MKNARSLAGAALAAMLMASCAGRGFAPSTTLSIAPPPTSPGAATDGDLYTGGVKVTPDFRDLGRAPGSTTVRLSIMLRYRHQPELDALVRAQSDRASPSFRHYLTNDAFAAYFAPSKQAQRDVVNALAKAGIAIVRTFRNRTIVEATGSSSAVERLFGTRIDFGVQTGYGRRYKNVTDFVIPPALRNEIVAVMGLDDLESFAPQTQIVYGDNLPRASRSRLRGPNGELGPLGFARAYDEPSQHGYDGTGRAIANTMSG